METCYMSNVFNGQKAILDVVVQGLGIPSDLLVKASEELEDDVQKDLQIPDPPKKKIVELAGTGKIIGALRPKD